MVSPVILKATPMTGMDRSPAELLRNRCFTTNIPIIQHANNLSSQTKLHNEDPSKYQTGSKALVPLNLGSCVLYDKNPDNTTKRPEWSKGVVTDIDGPGRKYKIESDLAKMLPEPGEILDQMDPLSLTQEGSPDPQII